MSTNLIASQIMYALHSFYGDLEKPSFKNVQSALDNAPYDKLIEAIRKSGVMVEEFTDLNDDVSIQLILTRSEEAVALELSLVGPFAVIRNLKNHSSSTQPQSEWVTEKTNTASPLANEIVSMIMKASSIQILDRETVATQIKMSLDGEASEASIYQALFTDTDQIPG